MDTMGEALDKIFYCQICMKGNALLYKKDINFRSVSYPIAICLINTVTDFLRV